MGSRTLCKMLPVNTVCLQMIAFCFYLCFKPCQGSFGNRGYGSAYMYVTVWKKIAGSFLIETLRSSRQLQVTETQNPTPTLYWRLLNTINPTQVEMQVLLLSTQFHSFSAYKQTAEQLIKQMVMTERETSRLRGRESVFFDSSLKPHPWMALKSPPIRLKAEGMTRV